MNGTNHAAYSLNYAVRPAAATIRICYNYDDLCMHMTFLPECIALGLDTTFVLGPPLRAEQASASGKYDAKERVPLWAERMDDTEMAAVSDCDNDSEYGGKDGQAFKALQQCSTAEGREKRLECRLKRAPLKEKAFSVLKRTRADTLAAKEVTVLQRRLQDKKDGTRLSYICKQSKLPVKFIEPHKF